MSIKLTCALFTVLQSKYWSDIGLINFIFSLQSSSQDHVLRGSSGKTHLDILEGKVKEKRARGRPRLTWIDDTVEWTEIDMYERIKTTSEDRSKCKNISVDLLIEDDTHDDT